MSQIVYVAGYGHSGSTILGILLGNAPGALNLGEANTVLTDPGVLTRSRPCAGEHRRPLRSAVEALLAELPEPHRAAVAALETGAPTRCAGSRRAGGAGGAGGRVERGGVEGGARRGVAGRGHPTPASAAHHAFWSSFFAAAEEADGARVLVDSSKTAFASVRRPALLAEAGHDVAVVHLVRDPRAVLYSLYKKARRKKRMFLGLKTLGAWVISNLQTRRLYRPGGAGRCSAYAIVGYERFVSNPLPQLGALGSALGLDLGELQAAVSAERPLEPGFQINGNRMSRAEAITLRPDWSWRTEAPRRLRVVGALGLPLYRLLLRDAL